MLTEKNPSTVQFKSKVLPDLLCCPRDCIDFIFRVLRYFSKNNKNQLHSLESNRSLRKRILASAAAQDSIEFI